jgi:RHS repeat-associated protein
LPGSPVETLTDVTHLAEGTAWRSRRIDPTGFYNLGARYYEPTTGRFLSPDPLGHGASMSLYDFCNGDPVNYFDPNGKGIVDDAESYARAYTDGLIRLFTGCTPLAHYGFYDPNDPYLQTSQRIGTGTGVLATFTIPAVQASSGIISGALAAHEIGFGGAVFSNAVAGTGISVVGNTLVQLGDHHGNIFDVDFDQQVIAGEYGFGFGGIAGVLNYAGYWLEQADSARLAAYYQQSVNREVELIYQGCTRDYIDASLRDLELQALPYADLTAAQLVSLSLAELYGTQFAEEFYHYLQEEGQFQSDSDLLEGGNIRIQQDATGKHYKPVN